MPLFTLPVKKRHTFVISPEMKVVIDSKLMDESQVKKFDRFPDLLAIEIDNELEHPDISNLEKDIFDAVYRNDYNKFFRCVSKVGARPDLLSRVYNWLISKDDFDPKKDMQLLKRLEGAKSIFNVFEY